MRLPLAFPLAFAVGLAAAASASRGAEMTEQEARRAIQVELAKSENTHRQIETLVEIAWLRTGIDPAMASMARRRIPEMGGDALFHLRRALDRVPKERTAEIAQTLVATRETITFGVPPDYAPALSAVLWVGDRKAKEIAIPPLGRERVRTALLPLIDSAIDDPELTPLVLEAAAQIGEDRARFWIERVLIDPSGRWREQAAAALATIGNKALGPLKNALRSEDRSLRLIAVRALLPGATENELTALYEYLGAHPDDDPATLQAVKDVAIRLERMLEERRSSEAASGSDALNP